jgi:hypothetical protein
MLASIAVGAVHVPFPNRTAIPIAAARKITVTTIPTLLRIVGPPKYAVKTPTAQTYSMKAREERYSVARLSKRSAQQSEPAASKVPFSSRIKIPD